MSPTNDGDGGAANERSGHSQTPRATARLVLQPGTEEAATYEISGTVLITRGPDNRLVVGTDPQTACSGIAVEGDGRYHLRNHGSPDRTMVNGRSVGDVKLTDGDVLSFGGVECHFEEGWSQAGT